MPFQSLRFIHAANLRLDVPPAGVGVLAEDARTSVEEATLTAFGRIVAACLERRVDFLLLTGNSFDEGDQSLRARVALRRGLRRLAGAGIPVFVLPGRLDPDHAWRSIADLPENVTLIHDDADEPVAVLREGRAIASVVGWNGGPPGEMLHDPAPGAGRSLFAIGLARWDDDAGREASRRHPFDYLALAGDRSRLTISSEGGLAHHPGAPQGLSSAEPGPHGCTLVEVAAEGAVRCEFLPMAPVRREALCLRLDPETDRNELIARIAATLDHCRCELPDELWLIEWTIAGRGPLFDALHDPASRDELSELLSPESPEENQIQAIHTFCPAADSKIGAADPPHPLAVEFFEALDRQQPVFREVLDACLGQAEFSEAAWANRLHTWMAEIDHDAVFAEARRLGADWFEAAGRVAQA